MKAQVILTPTEAKCFISKAIVRMGVVQKALQNGTVVIHPSSSTYFLVKEITGDVPRTIYWLLGCVLPQGFCTEANIHGKQSPSPSQAKGAKSLSEMFPFAWVIKKGKFLTGITLGELLAEMSPEDVYIKGCNAVDVEGNSGVLFGHEGGGTIAHVMGVQMQKRFQVVLAVGLEKLIPVSIAEAAKTSARHKEFDYGMGMPCGLYPIKGGTTVTEIQAVEILTGAKATPIASGGLGGAEGATVLVIEGDKEQVTRTIEYVEQSKGATLPQVCTVPCQLCGSKDCRFPVQDKHWYGRWIHQ